MADNKILKTQITNFKMGRVSEQIFLQEDIQMGGGYTSSGRVYA